jgi:hypothetical protein
MFERHPEELRQARQQSKTLFPVESAIIPQEIQPDKPHQAQKPTIRDSYRMNRFQRVKELQAQGLSQRAIARQMGIDRRTVGKYFALAQPPQKKMRPQNQSSLLPYLPYLKQRWAEGCHNRTQLLKEVQRQGYQGSYASLQRITAKLPADAGGMPVIRIPTYPWSPNQAAWLLMMQEDQLSEKNRKARTALLSGSQRASTALPLVQSFQAMVRERKADQFEPWLQQAQTSELVEFRRFAVSLRQDHQAILSGLSESWSNGQTEGQVNRLKLIKREMYGRANFDLLKRRFLGYG